MAEKGIGDERDDYCHDLRKGDHVIRWTRILVYPFQVHGIVLSAGPSIVTICDFGLTSNKPQTEVKDAENLEDMIDQEDQNMIKACEDHREERGRDRVNIITLIDEKEIKQWRKVNYGEPLKKQKDWRWWKRDNENDDEKKVGADMDNSNETRLENEKVIEVGEDQSKVSDESEQQSLQKSKDEQQDEGNLELHRKESSSWWCKPKQESNMDKNQDGTSENKVPKLPKSDPTHIVLSRVRYILNNPQDLPPHHIFYSNSECIAVFCKVGRWSTLQASIFFYSTAAGNLKTAILSSTGVAAATTTVTVPASGIAGWFGMTTTTTVSLLSVQPWLIPVLAGYGLIAVGTPIVLAQRAKMKWEQTTQFLNDRFWGSADGTVYVEAIKSWSNIK